MPAECERWAGARGSTRRDGCSSAQVSGAQALRRCQARWQASMQISTWALTRSPGRCQMGRRSRSSFADAEVLLHVGQVFAGGHGGRRTELGGEDGGADSACHAGGRSTGTDLGRTPWKQDEDCHRQPD